MQHCALKSDQTICTWSTCGLRIKFLLSDHYWVMFTGMCLQSLRRQHDDIMSHIPWTVVYGTWYGMYHVAWYVGHKNIEEYVQKPWELWTCSLNSSPTEIALTWVKLTVLTMCLCASVRTSSPLTASHTFLKSIGHVLTDNRICSHTDLIISILAFSVLEIRSCSVILTQKLRQICNKTPNNKLSIYLSIYLSKYTKVTKWK